MRPKRAQKQPSLRISSARNASFQFFQLPLTTETIKNVLRYGENSVAFSLKFRFIENIDHTLLQAMEKMPPITLDEMGKIRLMNRTDTKFLTNKEGLLRVLSQAQGDYFAQEIDTKRIAHYRTTYWDDAAHRFYVMHQNGHQPRMKVRVRTYEDSNGLTYLEIKRKDNKGKTHKKRTKVIGQKETEIIESGGDLFLEERTGIPLNTLHPCLQNYFKRITLVNRAMTERLTIDFDIQYTNFETRQRANSDRLVIIELKRDGLVYSPIKQILTDLHIHPKGYSKYIVGSFMTNPSLKRNLIKRKWVYINKVMNEKYIET